jgi:hypothetical protein
VILLLYLHFPNSRELFIYLNYCFSGIGVLCWPDVKGTNRFPNPRSKAGVNIKEKILNAQPEIKGRQN